MESAVLAGARHMLAAIDSGRALKASRKADHSIVTDLDIELEQIVLPALGDSIPIASEETPSTHSAIGTAQSLFLVDPLDGTSSCKRFFTVRGGQVGFGPLVGLLEGGKLVASAFYNVPMRTLFRAVRGEGVYSVYLDAPGHEAPPLERRTRLRRGETLSLSDSVVLFYPGKGGESQLIEYLKRNSVVDYIYRFGGFANDSSRLALGYEQIQVQFSVRAWDFSAALFPFEAGLSVIVDPRGARVPLSEWSVQYNNPVLVCPPELLPALLACVDAAGK